MNENLSAKQVAMELQTNPRTLRKFLREHLPKDQLPGQGGRYLFTKEDVAKLKKTFQAWTEPTPTQIPDDFGTKRPE